MPKKGKKTAQKTPKSAPAEDFVELDEALRLLRTSRSTLYRWIREGRIKAMKAGRQWRFRPEDLRLFLEGEQPVLDLPADIGPLIQTLRDRLKGAGAHEPSAEDLNPVQLAVRLMIALGLAARASDIHISPHIPDPGGEVFVPLRYRIDGVLHVLASIDKRLLPAIVEEWKRLGACNVLEKEKPQDARIMIRHSELAASPPDKTVDLRLCFLPTGLGESVTIRLLDRGDLVGLDRIEYAPPDRERLLSALKRPNGIVIITGPVGCGKSTVLYGCLHELAKAEIKAMTVEDPIEYLVPWAAQIAVNEAGGLTFARAMRSILRSDPDVIMIGEFRDLEALSLAQQAALTGHLVLSTLHADSAAKGLKRLVDMGSDPFLVADSTILVVAQRLYRKLCQQCAAPETPAPNRLEWAAEVARQGGLDWPSLAHSFRKAVGCEKCARTGYKGRNVIAETLAVTPEIGKTLRDGASVEEIQTLAVGQGMTTIAADGIRRAAQGQTSLEEIMRAVGIGAR